MRFLVLAGFCCWGLAGEPRRVVLLQELVRVEAMERKTVALLPLGQQSAQLEVRFEAKHGGDGVRVAVYEVGATRPAAETGYELTGLLRAPISKDRQYRIELENLRQRLGHGVVDVEVALVFGARAKPPPASAAQTLDPKRRIITIAASLALFALICAYSAVRLAPPVLRRWRGQR